MEWIRGKKKKELSAEQLEEQRLKEEVKAQDRELAAERLRAEDKRKLVAAFCRIESRGIKGSGILVEFLGHSGILTASEVIPDKLAARESSAVFEDASGKRTVLSLLPEAFFYYSKPSELNYCFVGAEPHPDHLPLKIEREKDCGFKVGDRVQLIQVDEAGRSLLTGLVYGLRSPKVTCYLQTDMGATGGVLAKDFKPVALHIFPKDDATVAADATQHQKGFLAGITCSAPRAKSKSGQTKGILLSAIMDNMQRQLPRGPNDAPIQRPVPPGVQSPFDFFRSSDSQTDGEADAKANRMCSVFGVGSTQNTRRVPEPSAEEGSTAEGEPQGREGESLLGQKNQVSGLGFKTTKASDFTRKKEPDASEIAAEAQKAREAAEQVAVSAGDKEPKGFGLVMEAWKPSGLASALNSMGNTRQTVRIYCLIEGLGAEKSTPKIERGDVVVAINNERIISLKRAKELLLKAGDEVILKLCRNQCEFQVVVRKDPEAAQSQAANTEAPDAQGEVLLPSAARPAESKQPGTSELIQQHHGKQDDTPLDRKADPSSRDDAEVATQKPSEPSENTPALTQPQKTHGGTEGLDNGVASKLQDLSSKQQTAETQGRDEQAKPNQPSQSTLADASNAIVPPTASKKVPAAMKVKSKSQNGVFGSGLFGSQVEPLRGRRKPQDSMQQLKQSSTVWMRGIIAHGSNPKELNLELLDKSSIGDAMGIERLVSLGADPNTADPLRWGNTPLLNAASCGNRMAVEVLLDAKADPNVCDHWGWTPLHRAAGLKHVQVIVSLLRSGARIEVRDSIGLQPRDIAKIAGNLELSVILSDKDKDIVSVLNSLVEGAEQENR